MCVAYGRHSFERMSNSLKVIACETILQDLLQRMADGPNPWESVGSSTTQCWSLPLVITFQDVENSLLLFIRFVEFLPFC